MTEELKRGEWSKNDMCTKLIKENGDVIVKLSEKLEKEVLDMFLNSEEVNLFLKEIDKKKLAESVTASVDKMLVEDRVYTHPLFAYDSRFPGGVDEKDLYEKQNQKNIKKATENQIWKTFKSNSKDTILQFLTYGPGKTNFKVFLNTLNSIINGVMSDRFIEKFGKIYNADSKLRMAFDNIMSNLTSNEDVETISSELLSIAKSIVAEPKEEEEEESVFENPENPLDIGEAKAEDALKLSDGAEGVGTANKINMKGSSLIAASVEDLNMFLVIANFIAIIMKYYEDLITKELNNQSEKVFQKANLGDGIKQLYLNILDCAKEYNENENKIKCFAYKYIQYTERNYDPIGPLLILIYTAITVYNMTTSLGLIKTTKSSRNIKLPSIKITDENKKRVIVEANKSLEEILRNKKDNVKIKIERIDTISNIVRVNRGNKQFFEIDLYYLENWRRIKDLNLTEGIDMLARIDQYALDHRNISIYDYIAILTYELIQNPIKQIIKEVKI